MQCSSFVLFLLFSPCGLLISCCGLFEYCWTVSVEYMASCLLQFTNFTSSYMTMCQTTASRETHCSHFWCLQLKLGTKQCITILELRPKQYRCLPYTVQKMSSSNQKQSKPNCFLPSNFKFHRIFFLNVRINRQKGQTDLF